MAVIGLICSSCGNKNAGKLLESIPKNTQYLLIVNIEKITHSLGSDGEKELDKYIGSIRNSNRGKEKFDYVFSKESEADLSSPLMLFELDNTSVITFSLKDADKFVSDFETAAGSKFRKVNGILGLEDNTAFVSGNQAWIAQDYPGINTEDIVSLTKLSKASSMASVEYTSEMIDSDADISMIVDLPALVQSNMNLGASLWLNMAFEDPEYLAGYIVFEKGKIEGEVKVLDSKCRPAPFALRPSKIDTRALKDFPGKGNFFFATSYDPATLSKIIGQVKSLLPLPPAVIGAIENIDGNIVISGDINQQSDDVQQLCAMVTFKDNASAQTLAAYLQEMQPSSSAGPEYSVTGNNLLIYTPNQEGESIESVADDFRGSGMALSVKPDGNLGASPFNSDLLKRILVKLVDTGDSSALKFTLTTLPGQNSLVSLLQYINSNN